MQNDPQPKHIFHLLIQPTNLRWVILLASMAVFCAILYPGLADTKLNYQIGDVAQRNIKASRDFLIEDRIATETNRVNAEAAVLTVYDHDTGLANRMATTIDKTFTEMRRTMATARETLVPPPNSGVPQRIKPDSTTAFLPTTAVPSTPSPSIDQIMGDKHQAFEERLGNKIDREAYGFLVQSGFAPAIARRITQILTDNQQTMKPISAKRIQQKAQAILDALASPESELSLLVVDDDGIAPPEPNVSRAHGADECPRISHAGRRVS